MGFLDQISKTINQGVDRARFEAEKFQRTTRIQGELNELNRQINEKMVEMGQRAYDLHRSGQINSATLAELAQKVESLRNSLIGKEEELKQAQSEVYVEPPPGGSSNPAQSVPIEDERGPAPQPQPQPQPPPQTPPQQAQKFCPNCGFQMPGTAMFCPNCGNRVTG
jgi:hypothetical protein